MEDLEVLAHWAVLHGDPDAARGPGDRFRRLGGEGTPELWELSTAEIAIAREVHPASCDKAIADVLDLRHRLPLTWRVVQALRAEVWVARRIASLSRALPLASVAVVDQAVAASSAAGGSSGSAAPTSSACGTSSPGSRPETRPGSMPPSTGSPTSSPAGRSETARATSSAPRRSGGWRGPPSCWRCCWSTAPLPKP